MIWLLNAWSSSKIITPQGHNGRGYPRTGFMVTHGFACNMFV